MRTTQVETKHRTLFFRIQNLPIRKVFLCRNLSWWTILDSQSFAYFEMLFKFQIQMWIGKSVVDSVLFERMLLSQIRWRILSATPNLDWQLSFPCSNWLSTFRKFSGVVDLDQRSKSTHAIFSCRCIALPLSP